MSYNLKECAEAMKKLYSGAEKDIAKIDRRLKQYEKEICAIIKKLDLDPALKYKAIKEGRMDELFLKLESMYLFLDTHAAAAIEKEAEETKREWLGLLFLGLMPLVGKGCGDNTEKLLKRHTDALKADLAKVVRRGAGNAYEQAKKRFIDFRRSIRRVIRTEGTRAIEGVKKELYFMAGETEYTYQAVLDLKTSAICRSMHGKVFPLSEAQAGFNYPPMHPNCRSYTLPGRQDAGTYESWYNKEKKKDPNFEAKEKKVQNASSDKVQYKKYRAVFGEEHFKTFAEFQDLKYNRVNEWEGLKTAKQKTLNKRKR